MQCWFIARVSTLHALLLALPFTVLVPLTLNVLLVDFGPADAAGTGAGLVMAPLGSQVTVLVVAGAGATAICPDLGARTIRDELAALRVMGIDPSKLRKPPSSLVKRIDMIQLPVVDKKIVYSSAIHC